MFDIIRSFGIDLNISTFKQALDELAALRESGTNHYVCFLEGNMLHRSFCDSDIRRILNGASLCYPDGVAAAISASLLLGHKVERVTGPMMIMKACEYGVQRGWRHYFYGGRPGVAEELAMKMRQKFPGVDIVGTRCPPFRELTAEELDELKAELSERKVDFLWVALGGPRQEIWMNEHLNEIPVPVMLGVGAAFDFHTERQPWAPSWIRRIGMEWLWRMCTGGRRVFFRNLICISHVALKLLWSGVASVKYCWSPRVLLKKREPQRIG